MCHPWMIFILWMKIRLTLAEAAQDKWPCARRSNVAVATGFRRPASELLLFTRRATSRFLMKELKREGRLPEFRLRPMVILRGDREIPVEISVCRRAC